MKRRHVLWCRSTKYVTKKQQVNVRDDFEEDTWESFWVIIMRICQQKSTSVQQGFFLQINILLSIQSPFFHPTYKFIVSQQFANKFLLLQLMNTSLSWRLHWSKGERERDKKILIAEIALQLHDAIFSNVSKLLAAATFHPINIYE